MTGRHAAWPMQGWPHALLNTRQPWLQEAVQGPEWQVPGADVLAAWHPQATGQATGIPLHMAKEILSFSHLNVLFGWSKW